MEHSVTEKTLTSEGKLFEQCMKTGDDFRKIEIYRLAKIWYRKALDTGVDNALVESRIKEIEQKQKSERKTILTLLVIAIVIVSTAYIIGI